MDNVDLLFNALSDLLVKATQIRNSYTGEDALVSDVEDPGSLYTKFVELRNGIDRLETLLNNSIRVKAKVDNMVLESQYAIEDAEVELAEKSSPDYQSSRDRSIQINAATITQRRASRRLQQLQVEARATATIIKNQHSGLESTIRDLTTRLRALSFITSYEK